MNNNQELRQSGYYILVAYRWGSRELHSYVVDLCGGIDTAKERAEQETDERGGKYSVAVYAKHAETGEIEQVYETAIPEHYKTEKLNFIVFAKKEVAPLLLKNSFVEGDDNSYYNEMCSVQFQEDGYAVVNNEGDTWHSNDYNIYSLVGYLTYYNFMSKNYNQ